MKTNYVQLANGYVVLRPNNFPRASFLRLMDVVIPATAQTHGTNIVYCPASTLSVMLYDNHASDLIRALADQFGLDVVVTKREKTS